MYMDACNLWPSKDNYVGFLSAIKYEKYANIGTYAFAKCQFPRWFLNDGTALFLYLPYQYILIYL